MKRVTFGSRQAANDFRDRIPEYLAVGDDRRSKTITLANTAPESIVSRAEQQGYTSQKHLSSGSGFEKLSRRERDYLKSNYSAFNWQTYGFNAMRAKSALAEHGVTEWLDYYEPGEGAEGALKNLESSKRQSAATGAALGITGTYTDVEEVSGGRQRQAQAERASSRQVQSAKRPAVVGLDDDARDFLNEESRFNDSLWDISFNRRDTWGRPDPTGRDFELLEERNAERSPQARGLDNSLAAPITRDPLVWSADPGHWDFPGIDTVDPFAVHAHRSARARAVDEQRSATIADSVAEWFANMGAFDLPGVDTPDAGEGGGGGLFGVEAGRQAGLFGGSAGGSQQAAFDVEPDVRHSQGRESRQDVAAASVFGIDDRTLTGGGQGESVQGGMEMFGVQGDDAALSIFGVDADDADRPTAKDVWGVDL